MNSCSNWTYLNKSKTALLTLSLGLAVGFAAGQMLHSEAHTSAKIEDSKSDTGSAVHLHTGTSSSPQKLLAHAPWWSMMHDPDTSWMLRNFDLLSSDFDHALTSTNSAGVLYIPRVDTSEQKDKVTISAEVPGIEEKDLDVTVNDDSVVIKGSKKDEYQSTEGKAFHSVERAFGEFERAISLPCKVESDKAQATLKNGVLTLTIPKDPAAQCAGKKVAIRHE